MKIFIVGHGRHGRDTVGDIFHKRFGVSKEDSSWVAGKICVWPEKMFRVYVNYGACFNDRHNHREFWYRKIAEFNTPDKARLSRLIFERNDLCVGIRDREEFLAGRQFADLAIWIEGGERVLEEDPTCKVLETDCDITINNNGTPHDLERKVLALGKLLWKT